MWDGADGASIPDALGDIAGQVDVIYQWLAETQTWRSHRPGGPAILSAFDTFERGASYWIRVERRRRVDGRRGAARASGRGVHVRLHSGWTEVVWRGADGAAIAEAFGADIFPQVEVIYRWLAETQTWGSFRPGAPAFLSAFDTFAAGRQLLDRRRGGRGVAGRAGRGLRGAGVSARDVVLPEPRIAGARSLVDDLHPERADRTSRRRRC